MCELLPLLILLLVLVLLLLSLLKLLMDLDKSLLRKIFNVPFSTPMESLYLELGCIDIETIIKSRRINYLHYLTKRNDDELIQRFFVAQWNYPHKHDWTEQVRKDLVDFKIPIDIEFIKSKSKSAFKNLVKSKSKEFAFERFICTKEKHSNFVSQKLFRGYSTNL